MKTEYTDKKKIFETFDANIIQLKRCWYDDFEIKSQYRNDALECLHRLLDLGIECSWKDKLIEGCAAAIISYDRCTGYAKQWKQLQKKIEQMVFMPPEERTIIPPEEGWEEQCYYSVDAAYSQHNPIHRAIFYTGFLNGNSERTEPGGYNQVWNPSYGISYRIEDFHYLHVLKKLEL